jgi:hypothetical protein
LVSGGVQAASPLAICWLPPATVQALLLSLIAAVHMVVGPRAGVGAFAQQVIEVDPARGVRVGGDSDHPGRPVLLELVQEQVGE